MDQPLVLLQARMGSRRLPGKSIHPFNGRPSLLHLTDSVRQCTEHICVLTSERTEDDAIVEICARESLRCIRGDEDNVASRFVRALEVLGAERFCRVSGDSPLFDWRVLSEAWGKEGSIVTTALEPRFPSGMHVEVFHSDLFLDGYRAFSNPEHFEHVTKYFYDLRYPMTSLPFTGPAGCRFSLDTDDDRIRLEQLFASFTKPHYEYSLEEKCRMYQQRKHTAPC